MIDIPTELQDNPLVNFPETKNGYPRFDLIELEHFLPAAEFWFAESLRRFEQTMADDPAATVEDFLFKFRTYDPELEKLYTVFYNLLRTNMTDEFIAVKKKLSDMSDDYDLRVYNDPAVAQKFSELYENIEQYEYEDQRSIRKGYNVCRNYGAYLDDESREDLKNIRKELRDIATDFEKNISDEFEEVYVVISDESRLKGLPQILIEKAKDLAEENGKADEWHLTVKREYLEKYLDYADDRELRKEVFQAFDNVASHGKFDNYPLCAKIVELKNRRLKYRDAETIAEEAMKDNMVSDPSEIIERLDKLRSDLLPQYERDIETLTHYAIEHDQISQLEPWDIDYYMRRYKEDKFKFSTEFIQEHLPLDAVEAGILDHTEKLFGANLIEDDSYPKSHGGVKVYEAYNSDDGEFIGLITTDLTEKKNKRGSAWMSYIEKYHVDYSGNPVRPIITVNANYVAGSSGSQPLLSIDDFDTKFHEWGHGYHGLFCDKAKYVSTSGTSVAPDLVEVPSHLQENWAGQKEVIQSIARHYITGEPLPEEQIDNYLASRRSMQSIIYMRQALLGRIDMKIHTEFDGSETAEDYRKLEKEFCNDHFDGLVPYNKRFGLSKFSHVFPGGYAANYHNYIDANLVEAAMFEEFPKKGDLYDKELGRKLREFYSWGGAKDPKELIREFLGRDDIFDTGPFLRREGLVPDDTSPKPVRAPKHIP